MLLLYTIYIILFIGIVVLILLKQARGLKKATLVALGSWFLSFFTFDILWAPKYFKGDLLRIAWEMIPTFFSYMAVGSPLIILLIISFYLSIKVGDSDSFLKRFLLFILPVSFSGFYYFFFFSFFMKAMMDGNPISPLFSLPFLIFPIIISTILYFKKEHIFLKIFFIFFFAFFVIFGGAMAYISVNKNQARTELDFLKAQAQLTLDIDYCLQMKDVRHKEWTSFHRPEWRHDYYNPCVRNIAMETGGPDKCLLALTDFDVDRCFLWFAMETSDSELCKRIESKVPRDRCYLEIK